MKINIAAIGLGHPFEIGYENAETLCNQTAEALNSVGVVCHNIDVVLHDLESVEKAVALFLDQKISFLQIPELIEKCMEMHTVIAEPSIEEILQTEEETYRNVADLL